MGQGIVYLILKKLLNYVQVIKILEYKKKVNSIFAKVKQLVKQHQSTIIKQQMIWDIILLILSLNSFSDDFKMTIIHFFIFKQKRLQECKTDYHIYKSNKLCIIYYKRNIKLSINDKREIIGKTKTLSKANIRMF